ncbi:MAG TPA: tRNA lysidine(34) synthetase TilS [Lacipirellulaceae bacterium]|nr:tRNA lysidine(34) synthetase TilS [Lacipirellulaceae bacterium]
MTNEVTNAGSGQHLEQRFHECWPAVAWCDCHVVVAVSGGPDSVALLRAMVSLKEPAGGRGQLFAAHFNHGLRGREADADEDWVVSLCERLKLPLEHAKTDVAAIAATQGDGWEAAARTARYDFLRHTAERLGARYVAMAHTADDQVETVLHRILRGTGLEGLGGMPAFRPISASVVLARPMLTMRRSEVLEYLAAIGQDFRSDISNADVRWTRNRLRKELLPHLREQYNSNVDTALANLAAQASESYRLVASFAANVARDCVVADSSQVRIDCRGLVEQPSIVVREVCKLAWRQAEWPEQPMGFEEWTKLAMLAVGGDKKVSNLPGNVRVHRADGFLILELHG